MVLRELPQSEAGWRKRKPGVGTAVARKRRADWENGRGSRGRDAGGGGQARRAVGRMARTARTGWRQKANGRVGWGWTGLGARKRAEAVARPVAPRCMWGGPHASPCREDGARVALVGSCCSCCACLGVGLCRTWGIFMNFECIFWDGADGETAFGRRRACDRIRGSIWAVADEVHSSVWVPCWFRRALIRRLGPYRPIQPPLFTSFVLPRHLPLFPPRALPSTTATTTTTIAPRRSLRVKLHPRPRQLNAKPVDDHPHPAQVAFPVLSLLPLPVSRSRSSSRTSPTRRMHILV